MSLTELIDKTLAVVDHHAATEPMIEWEIRSRDHSRYCEHGSPWGQRCFMCDHPEALLALTEVKHV